MSAKPVRLLIAALGGEGGGVLAAWIANAAVASGHFGQRTSIPGVAQRTGATTYYLEILPRDEAAEGRRPVLALNPAPGEVDVLLSSELLETVRLIQAGQVSPDRTLLIASTSRVYTVDEKSAMGDGRLDPERMQAVARKFARTAVLADFTAEAQQAKCAVNAVMLGALAASGVLPITADAFRSAIRGEGKAVDSNLRGFEAGLKLAEGAAPPAPAPASSAPHAEPDGGLEDRARRLVPLVVTSVAVEGVRRLVDYQGPDYAALYLDRLERFTRKPGTDDALIRELARHLAVRMSYEDTVRVAQLKLRAGRVERLRGESKAGTEDIVDVVEFLKPGPEEIVSILPERMARAILRFVERRGWSEKSFPMRVQTTRFGGFIRLRFLTALRRLRPGSLRNADEQAWIERWLSLVERSLAFGTEAAREVAETARLVKGYGETYKRGLGNWNRIVRDVIEPFLDGTLPAPQFADAVLQARLAALADPDGVRLDSVIGAIHALPQPPRIAAE